MSPPRLALRPSLERLLRATDGGHGGAWSAPTEEFQGLAGALCRRHEELLGLVAPGCESELEIWGVTHVLPGPPSLPRWVQQYRIRLTGGRWIETDAAYPEAKVIVELDGAAFHGSRSARERDLRKDTALAAAGWIVLRFSYARLMADPEGCRREIVAAVLARLTH